MMVAALVLTTACSKDGPVDEPAELIPQMTMTTQQSDVTIGLKGVGTISIDWGDKTTIETFVLDSIRITDYTHAYSGSSVHVITITGYGMSFLNCTYQGILSLDVSKNPVLTELACGYNALKNLDVSHNTALIKLDCYMNELTDLDVSRNTKMDYLNCHTNKLTDLDVSANTKLSTLYCMDNMLTYQALDAMFKTLHNNVITGKTVDVRANPGTSYCDISIATNKGWIVTR